MTISLRNKGNSIKKFKNKEVFTIGRYFRDKFGETVYKIPISISGFTCPNIDGTVAKGGCTFCENDSFSPNLQEKKPTFKLNPRVNSNPYLENQLKQLEMQFSATKQDSQVNLVQKNFLYIFNLLQILMHH